MKADFVLDYNLFAVERAEQVYLLARIQADANTCSRLRSFSSSGWGRMITFPW
jgi:hypothetical protein